MHLSFFLLLTKIMSISSTQIKEKREKEKQDLLKHWKEIQKEEEEEAKKNS
jgi:hypothetical protein